MPAPQTSSPPPPPPEVGTYQAVLPENINPVDGNAPPVADASLEGNDPTLFPDDAEDESNHDGNHPEPNHVDDGSGEDYSDEEEDNVNHGQPEHPHPIGTVFRHGRVDPFPSEDKVIDAIVDGAANYINNYLIGPSPNGASMTDEAIDYVLEEMPYRQRNIRDLMDLLQMLLNRNRNDVAFLRSVREPAPPPPAHSRSSRLSGREGGN